MAIIRHKMKTNNSTTGPSEVIIARSVVEWLQDSGWTVFQEVQVGERRIDIVAAMDRRRFSLWDYLVDEQQTVGTAGSPLDFYSAFRDTKNRVIEAVRERPGLTMREIVDLGDGYHYASWSTARAAIAKWISRGVIPGIERRRDGRTVRYFPAAPAATERGVP